MIRIGKNYQANVSQACSHAYLYRPLSYLKIWSKGEFNSDIFKKFKEKFGEGRTEEDLCLLLYQYQCGWDEISENLKNNPGLRKFYVQKDRNKM